MYSVQTSPQWGSKLLLGFVLLLSLFLFFCAGSSESSEKVKLVEYVWYDGETARRVYLQPGLLAVFGAADGAMPAADANLLLSQGRTRLFRVSFQSLPDKLKGVSSPVFTDSVEGGRRRALPGDVIVYFPLDWDAARVGEWATARGLPVLRKLPLQQNVFVLKTAAGLESLRIANELRGLPGVVRAAPNWWVEVSLRR